MSRSGERTQQKVLREKLFTRSMVVLFALTATVTSVRLVVPSLRDHISYGVLYSCVFAMALAMVHVGWGRTAAWLVALGGGGGLIVLVALSGGAESHLAAYLPMSAVACWSWLGRKAGIGVVVAISVALTVGAMLPAELQANDGVSLLASHESALILGSLLLVSVTRDLEWSSTRAQQDAARAEQAANAALEAHRSRDRFLEMMSHELRTPLDTVLGYTEMLAEEERDSDRLRDISRISTAGHHLQALVDDLLDMSRVLTGDIVLLREIVALDALVADVVAAIEPQARARGDWLTVNLPSDMPALYSDTRRVRQILLNLASNGVKYTDGGQITIDVSAHPEEIHLSVRDSGIGITREGLSALFRPFTQVHGSAVQRPGIGLGLALSQGIAHQLGGRIEVISQLGLGSTFTLVLPRVLDSR